MVRKLSAGAWRAAALAIIVGFAVAAPGLAASQTVNVTPGDMDGWGFVQETATGSGSLVNGPGTPPAGTGSARFVVNSSGGELLGVARYQGTKLADITKLEYSTYRTSGSAPLAVSLQLNVDYDLTDANQAWQGRLVFEPYHSNPNPITGAWQTCNPLSGKWWASGSPGNQTGKCPQSSPCTWAQVLGHFPNAGIHATLGGVGFKAGGGWAGGFDGNVDEFTIGINGDNTTYDFEASPVTKDDCKKDQWKAFATPPFKNQGDCVSWVNRNR